MPEKRGPGRPSKLNAVTKARLLTAIKRGAHLDVACRSAGVEYATVCEWRQRGEGRHPTRKATKEYAEFAEEITRAIADSEMALLTTIRQAAEVDAVHARWILERRFPERWANTQRIELQVDERVRTEIETFWDSLEAELDADTYERVLKAVSLIEERSAQAETN